MSKEIFSDTECSDGVLNDIRKDLDLTIDDSDDTFSLRGRRKGDKNKNYNLIADFDDLDKALVYLKSDQREFKRHNKTKTNTLYSAFINH